MAWDSIPTCKSAGLDVEYLMLRGFFMPPGVTQEQVNYYVDLFKKVRETPEWKDLMKNGAFNQTFMTGAEYAKWVANEEKRHEELMKDAGFLAEIAMAACTKPAAGGPNGRRRRCTMTRIE